jgi:coenzyme F420 hydrogenase subunit alpha
VAESVTISPTTRHEGHAKLVLNVDDEGIVTKAFYPNTTPVRGFETMLQGKPAAFGPIAVMRICGICQATHGIASCEAVENAIDAEIPEDGKILRELLGLGNRMHSHPLHHLLIADDLLKPEESGTLRVDAIKLIQKMRKAGQLVVDVTGGEGIHPPNLVVGGMRTNISERAKAKLYYACREYEKDCNTMLEVLETLIERYLGEIGIPDLGKHDYPYIATDTTFGNRDAINWKDVTEVPAQRFYAAYPEIAETATNQIPFYRGNPAEGGPRARMVKYGNFKSGGGAMDLNLARALENFEAVKRSLELIDELNINGATKITPDYSKAKESFGIGVHEAPRATNTHMAKMGKDGRIENYNIIAASTWNFPAVEKAIEGYHHKYAEVIMRAYDI